MLTVTLRNTLLSATNTRLLLVAIHSKIHLKSVCLFRYYCILSFILLLIKTKCFSCLLYIHKNSLRHTIHFLTQTIQILYSVNWYCILHKTAKHLSQKTNKKLLLFFSLLSTHVYCSRYKINGFVSLYNAKEYKTQTLKDTEINLKKLHGSYKIYTSQKRINNKP